MKRRGDKIVMVTAYDAPSARLADEAGVELILVGDTAAMVMLGHESTRPGHARRDDLPHPRRHARGAPAARRRRPALRQLRGLRRAGGRERDPAGEGGRRRRRQARGRRPDGLARARDRRVEHRGRGPRRADAAVGDEARRLPRAGAHRRGGARSSRRRARARGGGRVAIVLEAVPAPVAARITERARVPTIGIGAGAGCDGQVLVWHDLLGLYAGPTPASSAATPSSQARSATLSTRYAPTCATAPSPRSSTPTRSPSEELASFEAELARMPRAGRRSDRRRDRERRRGRGAPRPASSRGRRGRRRRAALPPRRRRASSSEREHASRPRRDPRHRRGRGARRRARA